MAQPWKREPERKSDLWRKLKYMNIVPAAYFISVCRSYFHFVYGVFQGQALLIFMVSKSVSFPLMASGFGALHRKSFFTLRPNRTFNGCKICHVKTCKYALIYLQMNT